MRTGSYNNNNNDNNVIDGLFVLQNSMVRRFCAGYAATKLLVSTMVYIRAKVAR